MSPQPNRNSPRATTTPAPPTAIRSTFVAVPSTFASSRDGRRNLVALGDFDLLAEPYATVACQVERERTGR